MSSAEAETPPSILQALAKLRGEMNDDIAVVEKMGEEVIAVRRRLRSAVQAIDLLEKMVSTENAGLRAAVGEKDAELAVRDARIAVLEAEVRRLETAQELLTRR